MLTRTLVLVTAACLSLAACGEEECTSEVAQTKMTALMAKVQEVGASDPAKLQEFTTKATEIQSTMVSTPAEACKAIDELMATLQ